MVKVLDHVSTIISQHLENRGYSDACRFTGLRFEVTSFGVTRFWVTCQIFSVLSLELNSLIFSHYNLSSMYLILKLSVRLSSNVLFLLFLLHLGMIPVAYSEAGDWQGKQESKGRGRVIK